MHPISSDLENEWHSSCSSCFTLFFWCKGKWLTPEGGSHHSSLLLSLASVFFLTSLVMAVVAQCDTVVGCTDFIDLFYCIVSCSVFSASLLSWPVMFCMLILSTERLPF